MHSDETDNEKAAVEALAPGLSPLYLQVREIMIDRISSGHWRPGDSLPSESRLAQEFDVSLGTVRKAVDSLVAQKLVVRHQGRGTFVAKHSRQRSLFRFFHIVDDDNNKRLPNSKILSLTQDSCTPAQAKNLNLEWGAGVYNMLRLRFLNSEPCLLERIALPQSLFQKFKLPIGEEQSEELYEFYERICGVSVVRAEDRLGATGADDVARKHLGVSLGTPLLVIDRRAYVLDGTPVEWRVGLCLSKNHKYHVNLV